MNKNRWDMMYRLYDLDKIPWHSGQPEVVPLWRLYGKEGLAVWIWDVPPQRLCRLHLLGEHRELHAVWSIITKGKKGYATHPETMRWRGKLKALYLRHEALVREMKRRGYKHGTPLDKRLASGNAMQTEYVDSPEEQVRILRHRHCGCKELLADSDGKNF